MKSGRGLKYVMVLGLGEVSFINVTGRIVDHPCSDIGPIISFPVAGFRPMKHQAGSWIRMMSNSVMLLLRSWIVVCFFRWMLSWAILMGRVTIGGHSTILKGDGGECQLLDVLRYWGQGVLWVWEVWYVEPVGRGMVSGGR